MTELVAVKEQSRLSQRLGLGFVLTLIPVFGIISFAIGWYSLREIRRSAHQLIGRKMALWCIIVGLIEGMLCACILIYLTRFQNPSL